MVAIAQLVEHRIVIPVVAGSIPVGHPNFSLIFPLNLLVLRFYGSGFSSLGVIAGTSWVSVTYLRHIVPILNSEDKLKYNNGMLIKLILASIVLVNLLSCSTNRKLDLPDKGNISSLDLSLLELAEDLKSEVAKEVWPGFSEFKTSVIYFTNEGQFLLNPKGAVPQEYHQTKFKGPTWSPAIYKASGWYNPDGNKLTEAEVNSAYLASAYSSEQTEKHFAYSVFALDSIGRFHMKDMKWDIDDWSAIFWHEVFHNYQDDLYHPNLISREVTNFSNVKSFVESEKFLNKIRKELNILSDALKAEDVKTKKSLICDRLIPMKLKRYKSMPAKSVTSEQFYEISEGTARYVEEMMSLAAGKLLASEQTKKKYSFNNFNSFKKYAARDRKHYFNSIKDVSPQKRYFYNTGFGLALLLDQVSPTWKEQAFKEKGFLFGLAQAWCK